MNKLFDILDFNRDGQLSRSELHIAAKRLGWHWHEAPVFAVLDLLTLRKPISRHTFNDYMNQMTEDPLGPYGEVLLNGAHYSSPISSENDLKSKQMLTNTLHNPHISMDDAALLIVDPQRSFTKGVWMQSIGSQAEVEVKPIQRAFSNCALFLNENYHRIETMFTRCPFPPDSYNWDDGLSEIIDSRQLYFVKPGNSVLFPHTNGFREWVESCIIKGKKILVMGGCTLNSCLRVSSIETQNYFENQKLQVVVDLSLSGARRSNYKTSPMYGGFSAVESAVREMTTAGVKVVGRTQWGQGGGKK